MSTPKKKTKVEAAQQGKKKPRVRFEGGLPDGTVTNSIAKYSAAWREFARPFLDEFGWLPYGYEPGISFWVGVGGGPVCKGGTGDFSTFHLNLGLAHKFRDLITEVRALRKDRPRRTICR